MHICLMSYEKTELRTLGDYMSNIEVSYVCMSYVFLTLGDYMSNIAGVLYMYV